MRSATWLLARGPGLAKRAAGNVVEARLVREPEPRLETPQAHLLARKPG